MVGGKMNAVSYAFRLDTDRSVRGVFGKRELGLYLCRDLYAR